MNFFHAPVGVKEFKQFFQRPFVVVFFGVILLSCSSETGMDRKEKISDFPDQESWNATIILTREGRKRAIVKAGHLTKSNKEGEIKLDEKVDADFYSMEEEHVSNLKSEIGIVDEHKDRMLAIGNVVVISDSGYTLVTDSLLWDSQQEQVLTEDNIRLTTTHGDTLYGKGFEANVDLTRWKIYKPRGVTGRVK